MLVTPINHTYTADHVLSAPSHNNIIKVVKIVNTHTHTSLACCGVQIALQDADARRVGTLESSSVWCFQGCYCVALVENTSFKNFGVICWSPPPSALPGKLSMNKRDSIRINSAKGISSVDLQ